MAHSTTKLHSNHYCLSDIYEATKKHYQQGGERKMERPTADSEHLKAYTRRNFSQNIDKVQPLDRLQRVNFPIINCKDYSNLFRRPVP